MNTLTTVNYKLLKKIKDDKFDVDDLHHYKLSMQIGTHDFQLIIVDSRKNKILLLEDYILASSKTYKELTNKLGDLFNNHHLLKAGFWKAIKVSFKNNKFSLVPAPLFSKDSLYDYLRVNARINPQTDELQYYKHIQCDAVNVFSVNKSLYNWLETMYKQTSIGYLHQASGLIEGVMSQLKHYEDNNIFLYIDRFKLHIITTRNKKLEYYNQFAIKQFSDYIKYIMTVMKELGHHQKTTPVILWGYIGKQSPHFQEFSKYIKNLSFGERPDFLKFRYFFDEVQDHHYFDLYSLNHCD